MTAPTTPKFPLWQPDSIHFALDKSNGSQIRTAYPWLGPRGGVPVIHFTAGTSTVQ